MWTWIEKGSVAQPEFCKGPPAVSPPLKWIPISTTMASLFPTPQRARQRVLGGEGLGKWEGVGSVCPTMLTGVGPKEQTHQPCRAVRSSSNEGKQEGKGRRSCA